MSEPDPNAIPTIELSDDWSQCLDGRARAALEQSALPAFLKSQRWFGGKARKIASVRIVDSAPFSAEPAIAFLTWLEVRFAGGEADLYFVPLAIAPSANMADRTAIVARLRSPAGEAVLHDALVDAAVCAALLDLIGRESSFTTHHGVVHAEATSAFAELRGDRAQTLTPKLGPPTSSNSLIFYGDRLLMKLFRRLEVGVNPDYEIGRFLTESSRFDRLPRVAGAIEYCQNEARCPMTLGIVQQLVPNQGDGWQHALGELSRYYEQAARKAEASTLDPIIGKESVGEYSHAAKRLGQRTAEMHLALASETADPAFAKEPITAADVEAVRKEIIAQGRRAIRTLEENRDQLPAEVTTDADELLQAGPAAIERVVRQTSAVPAAVKTRVHGDYHLGQVLWVDGDYVILDFEGEPTRTIDERREMFSPLRDVAGMLRSYHYAAYAGLFAFTKTRPHEFERLLPWAELWQRTVSATFLAEYVKTAGDAAFLPKESDQFASLLDGFMLAKAFYELSYELNNRPDWVRIPLGGVKALLAKREVNASPL
ncbi:MAG: putative maltokinase, partial [Planctomycetota bacterium]|nr:putative maltokinase [Planctomycetota bacterium]